MKYIWRRKDVSTMARKVSLRHVLSTDFRTVQLAPSRRSCGFNGTCFGKCDAGGVAVYLSSGLSGTLLVLKKRGWKADGAAPLPSHWAHSKAVEPRVCLQSHCAACMWLAWSGLRCTWTSKVCFFPCVTLFPLFCATHRKVSNPYPLPTWQTSMWQNVCERSLPLSGGTGVVDALAEVSLSSPEPSLCTVPSSVLLRKHRIDVFDLSIFLSSSFFFFFF